MKINTRLTLEQINILFENIDRKCGNDISYYCDQYNFCCSICPIDKFESILIKIKSNILKEMEKKQNEERKEA